MGVKAHMDPSLTIISGSLIGLQISIYPSGFPIKRFLRISHVPNAGYMLCESHPSSFHHPNNI
jgi:hypothetical protein